MKNVIIVGKITEKTKILCQNIARKLGYKFLDVEAKFDKVLLATIDCPLVETDEILKDKESQLLQAVAKKTEVVACIPIDMFLSNGNYDLFKNSFLVAILNENSDEIDKNIENLLKLHANLCKNEENLNENEIIEKYLRKIRN